MKEITKIVIKGTSGYCHVDEGYEDKIIITPNSIEYEYIPNKESQSETNIYRKWSYRTTSPLFRELYKLVAEMTPQFYKYDPEDLICYDLGLTSITTIYVDRHRQTINFFTSSEFFADYFRIIKKMVPPCEYIPAVLLTKEDYSNS